MSGPIGDVSTLFHDDFGQPLNPGVWDYNHEGPFYGRTYQRQELATTLNGVLHLELETYHNGSSFLGSEAITKQLFSVGGGIAFEVEARFVPPPGGMVGGLVGGIFFYKTHPTTDGPVRDEIDFELVSNEIVAGRDRVWTNIYEKDDFNSGGHPKIVPVTGPITNFHTYRVEWLPDRVRWLVDDQLVHELIDGQLFNGQVIQIPSDPMALHLNIWAPNWDWSSAYDPNLTPASTASDNQSYFFDIDSVTVTQLSSIYGTTEDDSLFGTALNDWIDGRGGNDTLRGAAGNDQLGGGGGLDTAVFSGTRSSYSIDKGAEHVTVTGSEGTDTLTGVERLAFANATVNLFQISTDFNGDCRSDFLWQNDSGPAAVWLLNTYSVIDGNAVDSDPVIDWHVKGSGDFNGDGRWDILWQHDNGIIRISLLDGVNVVSNALVGTIDWPVKGFGDFNGDGKSDILWQNDDGQVQAWLLDGLKKVGAGQIGAAPGAGWHVICSGDFNGDGKSDILWQNDNGRAAVWVLDGLSLMGADQVGGSPGVEWHIKGSGDFNGDGKSDILWQNDDGRAAVWLLDGINLIDGNVVGNNPGIAWDIVGSGDFNGDGKADIAWQHVNGQPAIWLMDGLSPAGADLLGTNPGAAWHLDWT